MRISHHSTITRDERGMSMFIVIMAMLVTSLFVAAGYAAANGDLPMSGQSKDRKSTYAAAEAGLNFYSYHLTQDNDYWTKCDTVPAPNATEPNPVNQPWDGTGADPRRWRTVPGGTAQYTVELIPATGYTACIPGNQKSLVDLTSGTFRLRFTGRPSPTSTAKRSVLATYRRDGFLNFIYFTDFEDLDPQAYATFGARTAAQAACGDKYRAARPAGLCTEIQFVTGDQINGPFHTNDDILLCGSPTYGRDAADRIEVSGPPVGWKQNGGCSGAPVFKGPFKAGTKKLTMPSTNTDLQTTATAGGSLYTGKTTIRLNGAANTMTVTNAGATNTVPVPGNGVVYVKNGGACTSQPPVIADYAEPTACGNLYISGTYSTSMTFGAANDIIIKQPSGSSNGDVKRIGDAVLGLIANNFVRVYHKVNRPAYGACSNYSTTADPMMTNVTIEAAILSLRHSFMVDNYSCGDDLGTLSVNGAIAQKYRGPVGTGSGGSINTGYLKNYTYDDRLRYRSPPFFLNPVDAAWEVVRSNEQVPAR